MSEAITQLFESVTAGNEAQIRENLTTIISQGQKIEISNTNALETLLGIENIDILTLTVEATAEIAKIESNRKKLTKVQIIKPLLTSFKLENHTLSIQTCRALGNICFENEEARKIIGTEGLETILSIIRKNITSNDNKLLAVACGFLLNLLMDSSELQKAALENNILNIIENIFTKLVDNVKLHNDTFTHLLLIVNILSEHLADEALSESLCCSLVDVIKTSENPEISVLCLEILHGQSENSEIKLCLAKKGTCELIFDLVETHRADIIDEETRAVLKMACELIVLILTGDEPMALLYNNGDGKVYKNMILWLNSNDSDLQNTGILAVGNFARKDTHCIQMVEYGIAKKLLELLKLHNGSEEDIKLQYALLSTLRNLTIPAQNKAKILNEGLIDILYPMIKLEHSSVLFKLFGTFRMIIDKQENAALDMAMRRDLLEKLVDCCCNSDHLGVRGEASRLLAWLIRYCQSSKPYSGILQTNNCVKCLVEMVSSNHAVMQNEAFFALNLLCASCLNSCSDTATSSLEQLLIDSDIGKHLVFIMNKYKSKMEKETVENVLTLLERLQSSQRVVTHLKNDQLGQVILQLLENKSYAGAFDRINRLAREF